MAPIIPSPNKIKPFKNQAAFAAWLAKHHARESEIWIKVFKRDSGTRSITCPEALEVALCWGWIDAIRKGLDDKAFLQRYTPRRRKSLWSQVNREHIARLTKAGLMQPPGQAQVDAARADGRWDAAYAPIRSASKHSIPADLRAAIEASPRARKTFHTLSKMNLFALTFRVNNLKTPAARARKVVALVEMLARGETIVPERTGK